MGDMAPSAWLEPSLLSVTLPRVPDTITLSTPTCLSGSLSDDLIGQSRHYLPHLCKILSFGCDSKVLSTCSVTSQQVEGQGFELKPRKMTTYKNLPNLTLVINRT